MKVSVSICYHTLWGESLVLSIGSRRFEMSYSEGDIWRAEVPLGVFEESGDYGFELVGPGGEVLRREWRRHISEFVCHAVSNRNGDEGPIILRERWLERPSDSPLWSSAFVNGIFARPQGVQGNISRRAHKSGSNVSFMAALPHIRPGQFLAIAGGGCGLSWDAPLPLDDSCFPWWSVSMPVNGTIKYKFVIADSHSRKPLFWEEGPDRELTALSGETIVLCDAAPVFRQKPWRGSGIAVPVFSLRSEESFGIGDFADLKLLVDWAAKTGLDVIQILPVNDTTMGGDWQDSYPYNANSSFALHPQFLRLESVGVARSGPFKKLQKELNSLPQVDYEKVNKAKRELLWEYFCKKGRESVESPECESFVKENEFWLKPYCAYCVLREKFGSLDFSAWGRYEHYDEREVSAFISKNKAAADFYLWEQFLLDRQLKEVSDYARGKGIILKGDLPIGVSRYSADVWSEPSLFNLDSKTGAPPDAFTDEGQNWGFPTYNWDAMAADGFLWWRRRLAKMNEYFDAFRIDHILGFFRIWEIPQRYSDGMMGYFSPALPYSAAELLGKGFDIRRGKYVKPLKGRPYHDVLFIEDPHRPGFWHPRFAAQKTRVFASLPADKQQAFNELHEDFFYHRHNAFWKESGYRKLPALLSATGMLACGEDLGMVPQCVPETMADLGVLSLEIQRMPKAFGQEIGEPSKYPYYSVCATGTHDMDTLRAWLGQRLGGSDAPAEACENIIREHLESPSMLAIFPIQDWLSIDKDLRYQGDPHFERINVPAESRHYWRYRMHISLEKLLTDDLFAGKIRSLVRNSGRG